MTPIVEKSITHGLKLNLLLKQEKTPAMILHQAFVKTNGGGFNSQQLITNMEVASDQSIWTNQEAPTEDEDLMLILPVNKSITGNENIEFIDSY